MPRRRRSGASILTRRRVRIDSARAPPRGDAPTVETNRNRCRKPRAKEVSDSKVAIRRADQLTGKRWLDHDSGRLARPIEAAGSEGDGYWTTIVPQRLQLPDSLAALNASPTKACPQRGQVSRWRIGPNHRCSRIKHPSQAPGIRTSTAAVAFLLSGMYGRRYLVCTNTYNSKNGV